MIAGIVLYKHAALNNDGFTAGQVKWIVAAMEEYSNFKINEIMKSRAYYNEEQFKGKILMTDDVWDDMDDEMLDKVTEFEKHISSKLWQMFIEYLKVVPSTKFIEEKPYIRPLKKEKRSNQNEKLND